MPHIHEKIDFVTDVIIVHNNKVLLRKHDKYNKWLFPGGHIELDEDPTQAAIREVKEEVGLDIKLFNPRELLDSTDLTTPMFVNRHRINENHEHISFLYLATADTDELILSKTEVSEECRWCTREDLDKMDLTPIVKHYAKIALETLSK